MAAPDGHRLTDESHWNRHDLWTVNNRKHDLTPLWPDAIRVGEQTVFPQIDQCEHANCSTSPVERVEHNRQQNFGVVVGKHVANPAKSLVTKLVIDEVFLLHNTLDP